MARSVAPPLRGPERTTSRGLTPWRDPATFSSPPQPVMKRIEAHFSGRVQGVGFRMTVQNLARGYDVNGTVQNLPDGRVQMIAEGAESELTEFLKGIEESDLAECVKPATMRITAEVVQ